MINEKLLENKIENVYGTAQNKTYSQEYTNTLNGLLSNLNTTDKSNIVNAINEVLGSIPHMVDQYESSLSNGYSCDYINDTIPTMANSKGTSTTNGYSQSYCNSTYIVKGTSLYNNSTGSNGTITLSSSSANYSYLEIYYKDNDGHKGFVKVDSPNGSTALLFSGVFNSSDCYLKGRTISISGNKISTYSSKYGEVNPPANTSWYGTGNNIYITRVIGYN